MSSHDQMGTALGAAAILLLACFAAAGLLLLQVILALFSGGTTAREYGRLAVAWWIVSGVILVAGLVAMGASPHVKAVLLLLTFGVPAIGVGMGLLASRRAGSR